MQIQKEWQDILEDYREKLVKLRKSQELSIDVIKLAMAGVTSMNVNSLSFIGVWENLIRDCQKQDRVGTAENYQWALNSFLKLVGRIEGFKIDINVMQKWNDAMKNGILIDGELVGKIADATRGMYLRTSRVVWNECIKQGYLAEELYPFSNTDKTKISIPRGSKRQQSYLTIDEMTELYKVFMEKRYPSTWGFEYRKRAHMSLGLFLVQYLCNGFNLADAGRLIYDRTYFAEGGRAFKFQRKKTAARSNGMAIVIVPIIEPLRNILDEIAARPTRGGVVFPQIFNGATEEAEMRKLCVQENSNIKDRVIRICKEVLEWDKEPSGTWARHSFATNLKIAGVEELYISESMGHAQANNVTTGYQDMYPLEIRFRNNNKLLNVGKKEVVDLDNLSPDEMKAMLKRMLSQS